jgi:hypothetical protein
MQIGAQSSGDGSMPLALLCGTLSLLLALHITMRRILWRGESDPIHTMIVLGSGTQAPTAILP